MYQLYFVLGSEIEISINKLPLQQKEKIQKI